LGARAQARTLTFSGFGKPVAGDTYIRCRIASEASEVALPTGRAYSNLSAAASS